MTAVSDKLIITTNDGSEGMKGFVTDPLKKLLSEEKLSLVIAIGPMIMMKNVALMTSGVEGLPRVETLEIHFACVEGPDVDGHMVDFDILLNREKRFTEFEKKSFDLYKQECRVLKGIEKN